MKAYKPENWEQLKRLSVWLPRNAVFVAGGTDLIIKLRTAVKEPESLIYLGNMPELQEIRKQKDGLFIGAACTMSMLMSHPLLSGPCAALSEAAAGVGSVQIRNRATIGGNIAHASAAADMAAPLMCLRAEAAILKNGKIEKIPVSELIVGNEETVLGERDVILGFLVPPYTGRTVSHYHKLAFREEVSISRFGIAVMMKYAKETVEDISVYIGAIGPKAVRMPQIERLICGKPLTEAAIREAGGMLSAYIGETSKRKYKMWAAESVMADALRLFLRQQEVKEGVDTDAAIIAGGL